MNPPTTDLRGAQPTRRAAFGASLRDLARSPEGLLLAGLALLLLLGSTILTDFGASIDEWHNTYYGRLFLSVYETGNLFRSTGIDYFNGPFYFMLFNVTARLFALLRPGWLFTDGLHFTNFLTFVAGLYFLYRFGSRMLPRGAALFVTALFATQPVLFGHAFINQKDTPLMVYFLAAVELGWTAVERYIAAKEEAQVPTDGIPFSAAFGEDWKRLRRGTRILILSAFAVAASLLVDVWFGGALHAAAVSLLSQLYAGQGPAWLVSLFQRIAVDAHKTPLAAYVAKLDSFYFWSRIVASGMILAGGVLLWRLAGPRSYDRLVRPLIRRWGLVLAAGIVLGLATSIRMLGPFAGVLVAGYWIGRSGRRAVGGLLVYSLVAMLATYLTWPALWGNPLNALLSRASEVSEFARYEVFFQGGRYEANNLPLRFLPVLLAIQLTLPSIVLFLAGIPYSMARSLADRTGRLRLGLTWLWFLTPVAAVMIGVVPIYNNFRHVLFALPPAFVIMGFAAWKASEIARSAVFRAGLAAIALLPGLIGIVRLHPYEYVYYNELVGGTAGAEGEYDLDYWCTAVREAMGVANLAAGPEALVVVGPSMLTAAPFAREDLEVRKAGTETAEPEVAVACRREVRRPTFYPAMETIYEVRADGALLAIVKER